MLKIMYTTKSKQLVKGWGNWLGTIPWDYFSTITYRVDVSSRRNETIMFSLEKHLSRCLTRYMVFWVMEQTYKNHHTHNHILIQGENTLECIEKYLTERSLVDKRFIKHEKYNKDLGASFYLSKGIHSPNARYGFICPPQIPQGVIS